MYCRSCKRYFSEPNYIADDPSPSGISLGGGSYYYSVCPHCGSESIEDSKECVSCGDDMHGDGILCEDCEKELSDKLTQVKESMKVDSDTFEDMIAEHFGW